MDHQDDDRRTSVHPAVDRAASYAWRLLVIAAVVVAALWLIGRLLVVVIPVVVALLLARALSPVASWLRRRGLRPGLAAAVSLFGFLVVLVGLLGFVGANVASEVDELRSTLTAGVDDVQRWLVEDSPFDLDEADVQRLRDQAGDALSRYVQSGEGAGVRSGARVAAEVVVGLLLSIVVTFFFVKDGRAMIGRLLRSLPDERRERGNRYARRAWEAIGGYLRAAAALGALEAVVMGVTLAVAGARLVGPVVVLTFLAAFVPIVGAVTAGIVAALVTLVTAGATQALIVVVVAVVVQQLDNDLLAPVIYGRAVNLSPLVVLLGIAAGGALFGFVGTLFAVPFLAVTLNVVDEARRRDTSTTEPMLPELSDPQTSSS